MLERMDRVSVLRFNRGEGSVQSQVYLFLGITLLLFNSKTFDSDYSHHSSLALEDWRAGPSPAKKKLHCDLVC